VVCFGAEVDQGRVLRYHTDRRGGCSYYRVWICGYEGSGRDDSRAAGGSVHVHGFEVVRVEIGCHWEGVLEEELLWESNRHNRQ